ncbi:MAG: pentapeptide repeat-containing protein [Bacteroidia bacterium]
MLSTKMIGSRIAEARKKKSISQAQLAQQLFISSQAVGKWERGESMPDILTLNRLAEILGVDLNYFSESFQSAGNGTVNKASDGNNASTEREMLNNFSGSNLPESDFAGVVAHKRKFNGSALQGTDFSGADLTGSSFIGSDVSGADFNATNLTDCSLKASDLKEGYFHKTILVRTVFSSSDLTGAKFIEANLTDVRVTATDLTKAVFEDCSFTGVVFKSSDLSGLNFDGQTFSYVRFDKVALKGTTFRNATLKNVSFLPSLALTNKYFRAVKTINFEGAKMDKLTYAVLKSYEADLAKVTLI